MNRKKTGYHSTPYVVFFDSHAGHWIGWYRGDPQSIRRFHSSKNVDAFARNLGKIHNVGVFRKDGSGIKKVYAPSQNKFVMWY